MISFNDLPPEPRWGPAMNVCNEDSDTVIRVEAPGLWHSSQARRLMAASLFMIIFGIGIPAFATGVVIIQQRGWSEAIWVVPSSCLPSLILLPVGILSFRSARCAAWSRSTIRLGDGFVEVTRTMPSGATCRVTPENFYGTMVSFQLSKSFCWELLLMIGRPRGGAVRVVHYHEHDDKENARETDISKTVPKSLFQVANGRTPEELIWLGDKIAQAVLGNEGSNLS